MNKWIEGLPTKSGNYWFYGWSSDFDKRNNEPHLVLMKTVKISNGLAHIANGQFYYADSIGKHMLAELPKVPEL